MLREASSEEDSPIVKTYGLFRCRRGEVEDMCQVMDLVPGEELRKSMVERKENRRRWTEREVLLMMRALLEQVEYLHRRGLAHRDIKPENVMWDGRNFSSI